MTTEELQDRIAATSGWITSVKEEMGRVLVGQDRLVPGARGAHGTPFAIEPAATAGAVAR